MSKSKNEQGKEKAVVTHWIAKETAQKIDEKKLQILKDLIKPKSYKVLHLESQDENSKTYKILHDIFGDNFVGKDAFILPIFVRIISQTLELAKEKLDNEINLTHETLFSNEKFFPRLRALAMGGHIITDRKFRSPEELLQLARKINIKDLYRYLNAFPFDISDPKNKDLVILTEDIKHKLYGLKAISLIHKPDVVEMIQWTLKTATEKNIQFEPNLEKIMRKLTDGGYTEESDLGSIKVLGKYVEQINNLYFDLGS